MANTIIELRHSNISGNVPASLANGEIAINTYDGKLFYRGGVSNTIQSIEGFAGPAGLDTEIQFNDSGSLGADSGLTYNKTTDVITVAGGAIVAGVNVVPQILSSYDHANAAFNKANTGATSSNVTITTFAVTANGAQTTFDLGWNPVSAETVIATIDGVIQPDSSYSVSNTANTITFNTAPGSGEAVRVLSLYSSACTNLYIIADGSVTNPKIANEAVSLSKLSDDVEDYILDKAVAMSIALG